MKIFDNKIKMIYLFLIIACILARAQFLIAQEDEQSKVNFRVSLQEQAGRLLNADKFQELLDYLLAQGAQATDIESLSMITYYTLLAKSSYLDFLEKNEDWQQYYNQVHSLNKEIIDTGKNFIRENPDSLACVDMQYLVWRAFIREDDEKGTSDAFDELVKKAIAYTEKNNDASKFLELVRLMSEAGKLSHCNKMFTQYEEYLLKTDAEISSIERIAAIGADYAQNNNFDMSRIVFEHYINLVLKKYSEADAQFAMIRICDLFRDHGFFQAKDADFAEKIYGRIEDTFGSEILSEVDLFARGYNLDAAGNHERANEEYRKFIKTFSDSRFVPEVYARLGIINLYCLGLPGQGKMFFEKVIDEFPGSFHLPFCLYEMALLAQWQKEDAQASRLYSMLSEYKGEIAEAAAKRRLEIEGRLGMERDVRYPFDLIFEPSEASSVMLTLDSIPRRCFSSGEVKWQGTAQDFSAGTVQPLFTYEWFRDTGIEGNPGNVNDFIATYAQVSPKIVCFSASTGDSKNVICRSLWVHDIVITSPMYAEVFKINTPVSFSAEITPPTIEEKNLQWKWTIFAQETVRGEGKNFSSSFSVPGHYEGQLEVSVGEVRGVKKFIFDIVE